MFPENGKLVSGLIEPRTPSPGSTRIAPASGADHAAADDSDPGRRNDAHRAN